MKERSLTLTDGNKIIGYIYPYVPGQDLSVLIRQENLNMGQILRYGAQIGHALQTLHDQGIFHRDIKPANIRISGDEARLMDFDLARASPSPGEPHISPKGTKAYRAPEASTPGAYSEQSEAWSLGVILYQMAFHKLPFASEWDAASDKPIELPDQMHPTLRAVIAGLLTKDPSKRMRLEEATRLLENSRA
jgi:eukaryotic-like serine/threonine-protein kinase